MRRLAFLALFCSAATSAAAQSSGTFAVGAQVFTRRAPGKNAHSFTGVALLWRLGHGKRGWGPDWGLNWYSTSVDDSLGNDSAFQLGELHVRPFMGGYGYTRIIGRAAVKAGVLGGYALTSFTKASSASDAYLQRLGVPPVSTDTANTFVIKPQISIWYDISEKVGVNVSTGYMVARPRLTVSSALGDDRRRIRADMFMVRVGLVYSVH